MHKTGKKYPKGSIFSFSIVLLFCLLIFADRLCAQNGDPSPIHFPTPKNVDNMLFYLQRDPNTNTLIYALNLAENGDVNRSQPVSTYWIRYAEKGERKELGYIQRKFAYGILSKELSKDHFELRLVSQKAFPLYLSKRDTDQQYEVTATVNGKKIRVTRIFVRIVGGSFWLPNVKYAQIEGTDIANGKPINERITVK
ncbi:DUF4833 domain-containing protein [Pedobacter chinensis]|uniref:DUF4833 domain-containing protein n=2 Tax=Pedobacter chinensis TaxID=2282421 RepID=A0A369PTN4_9SPHI|nr:DUF4833 domain-containing protein [Pedobacter chinensis]